LEVGHVRRRVVAAISTARARSGERRQQIASAEQAYAEFLQNVATPLFRQLAASLKAEGYLFTVFTPGDGLRLASDKGREDFVELSLDTSLDTPQVMGRISQTRGSRKIDEERPLRQGGSPGAVTEDDLLDFMIAALEPWLGR
jgi:hypothetical protein